MRPEAGGVHPGPFRLLLAGRTASTLGSAIAPVALAFAVLRLTGSVADLGLVLAAEATPLAALILVGGVIGDRSSRYRTMIGADLLRALIRIVLAGLLLTSHARIWQILALMAVSGAADALFTPASQTLMPAIVPPDQLQRANALVATFGTTAAGAGPLVGGLIAAAFNPSAALGVDALTFVISAASISLLQRTISMPAFLAPHDGPLLPQLHQGWREFRARRWLVILTAFACGYVTLVMAPIGVLGPEVARRWLGGAWAWGLIGTAAAAGGVLGGILASRWMPRRPMRAGCLTMVLAAPEPVLLAIHAALPLVVAGAVLESLAVALFNILLVTVMQRHIPLEALSRVQSWDILGSVLCAPLGFALAGSVGSALGVRTVLSFAGAWILLTGLLLACSGEVGSLTSLAPATPGGASPGEAG